MPIEIDGVIGQISFRNGGWRMQVFLQQPGHKVNVSNENGKVLACESFKELGEIELTVTKEIVDEYVAKTCRKLKLLVDFEV